jgi:hypothetical protein
MIQDMNTAAFEHISNSFSYVRRNQKKLIITNDILCLLKKNVNSQNVLRDEVHLINIIIHSCSLLISFLCVLTDDNSFSHFAFFKNSSFLSQDFSFMSIYQRTFNAEQHCCHLSSLQQITFSKNHFTELSFEKK